jgi:hypothetical protein
MNGAAARSLRAGMAQLCLLLLLPIAVQLPRLRTSVTLRRPGTYRSFFSCSSLGALGPRKYSKNRMVPATKEVKGESTPRARTHACTNTRRRAHRCCALAIALALLLSSSLNSGSCHGVPCLPCRALYTHGQPILQISTRKGRIRQPIWHRWSSQVLTHTDTKKNTARNLPLVHNSKSW